MRTNQGFGSTLMALAAALLAWPAAGAQVEVLNYWTSGGEARAAQELKRTVESRGHVWSDFAVAGGAGDNANTVLQARVAAGDPPTAAQIKTAAIRQWAAQGALGNLDALARTGHWDQLLPPVVAESMKVRGHYVAVPLDVHRVNWLWVNPQVFRQAGASVPRTWDELLVAAGRIQRAGYVALAHGGQPWQDFTIFESVVLGVAGPEVYRKALVELDPAAFTGAPMIRALGMLRSLHPYIDRNAANRDWNQATALLIDGKAGMQFMGDWAKGEFSAAGRQAGRDYQCVPVPGTAGAFIYDIDSLAMFAMHTEEARRGQADLAEAVMGARFQENFNLSKGAIPARRDLDLSRFDDCARESSREFASAARSGSLLPSVAHGMAQPATIQLALEDVVTQFFNGTLAPREAANRLAAAARRR